MIKYIILGCMCCVSVMSFAQGIGKQIIKGGQKALARKVYVRPQISTGVSARVAAQVNRAAGQAVASQPAVKPTVVPTQAASRTGEGILYVGIPVYELGSSDMPRRHPIHKRYPSGLLDEEQLIADWLEYFKNGYFQPRDQVEAIEGMRPAKMNNIIEYLYPMSIEEAEQIILNPLRETGRLPDFMYDANLIPGTQRLPSGYYKNKFNKNVNTFVRLAEQDGSVFTYNVQLKDLISSMKDYNFKQGFTYQNCPELTNGLRKNWEVIMAEIRKPGVTNTNRQLVNEMWTQPVKLPNGTTVSLKEYFTQRRKTAFFEQAMPEFYLNSPKWVALENERRNLIAKSYPFAPEQASKFNQLQKYWVLGDPDKYLTLEQFGQLMTASYQQMFGEQRQAALSQAAVSIVDDPMIGLKAQTPTSTTIKVNNFDKLGGVCQMAFTDGGYMGRVQPGYDGTTSVDRFEPVVFDNVRVVTFDMETLRPRVVTLDKVSYVKDLKQPDIDRVRASSMVGDGLDASRDVLTVEKAEKALHNIPHLRATIYPNNRVKNADQVPYMNGGGLAAYLALFTPDFYPIKTVRLLQRVNGEWKWVPTHFIRKEVLTHAGFVHRDHLTFTEQVQDRIVNK